MPGFRDFELAQRPHFPLQEVARKIEIKAIGSKKVIIFVNGILNNFKEAFSTANEISSYHDLDFYLVHSPTVDLITDLKIADKLKNGDISKVKEVTILVDLVKEKIKDQKVEIWAHSRGAIVTFNAMKKISQSLGKKKVDTLIHIRTFGGYLIPPAEGWSEFINPENVRVEVNPSDIAPYVLSAFGERDVTILSDPFFRYKLFELIKSHKMKRYINACTDKSEFIDYCKYKNNKYSLIVFYEKLEAFYNYISSPQYMRYVIMHFRGF